MKIKIHNGAFEDNFEIDNSVSLPLLRSGEIKILGWDIPIYYAIDSNKKCFMSSGLGGDLQEVKLEKLIIKFTDHREANVIRKLFGLKLEYPWINEALSLGWVPPINWDK